MFENQCNYFINDALEYFWGRGGYISFLVLYKKYLLLLLYA